MPNIIHRLSIDAPPERVHQLAAAKEGIEQRWTGHPVAGDDAIGGRLSVYFRDPADPAATFEVVQRVPEQIVWRCVAGSPRLVGHPRCLTLKPATPAAPRYCSPTKGWRQENEFVHGCSTNWAAYLMSLQAGAEGGGFNAFPGGEISRWN